MSVGYLKITGELKLLYMILHLQVPFIPSLHSQRPQEHLINTQPQENNHHFSHEYHITTQKR